MENTIKPKRRTRAATAATPTTPAAAIVQMATMPTQEELTALYNSLSIEERTEILTESKVKPAIAAAVNALLVSLASIGIKFKDPVLSIGSDPESMTEEEKKNESSIIWISPDGSYEEDNDDPEDEEEDEEDDEEEAEISPKKLIKALKEMMEEKTLSQSDVASKLKIVQGTVSNWLTGQSDPRNGMRKKLAKFVSHYLDE